MFANGPARTRSTAQSQSCLPTPNSQTCIGNATHSSWQLYPSRSVAHLIIRGLVGWREWLCPCVPDCTNNLLHTDHAPKVRRASVHGHASSTLENVVGERVHVVWDKFDRRSAIHVVSACATSILIRAYLSSIVRLSRSTKEVHVILQ